MIAGVKIKSLKQIPDERGKILQMLRVDSGEFISFGEIYFSYVYPKAIKAWRLHKKMTLNYAVPLGTIKLVLYDNRTHSSTYGKIQEIITGVENYSLITIPPLIWNGFTCIGNEAAMVANCSTLPHDPNEVDKIDPYDPRIPYNWNT